MKQLKLMILMLCCLMFSHQAAWADDDPNSVVFRETFDQTSGTGGRDGNYSGSIASSAIKYDNNGWADAVKCGGAFQCVKYGTGSDDGVLKTPEISLGGATHALLTFSAAGWGDTRKNTLVITANDGITLSGDTNIEELENEEWTDYTVLITVTSGSSLQLTFSGRRGFIDDIVVRTITTVPAPSLPEGYTFFPNTDEASGGESIMLTPVSYTTAYYTTDGSTPSNTNGTEALLTTNIAIHGTTTVKAIAYVGNMASEVVSRTYTQGTTVEGITAFKALADGTEARLFLRDDASHETRVLYYDESRHQLFLRENNSALCFDFGETATFNPTPQHNQHVAGWVVGQKATENGLPKLAATANTNTDYLAIANPVTESQTMPASISNSALLGDHAADWVTLSEQRVGNDLAVVDRFGTGAYDGALADLSGIAIPNGGTQQIAPFSVDDKAGVVYVIDENQDFVSPGEDIANATVRLKRTLSKDYWNTFAVPFNISNMNASIRQFDHVDGNTLVFTDSPIIEAGTPYLVKPNEEDLINQEFSNVTLTAEAAKTITGGSSDYKFTATYSPRELKTDKTELFLTTNGQLGYPETVSEATLKGMRAFFEVPAGVSASVFIEGSTGVIEVRGETEAGRNDIYNLNGQRVTQPRKGLYIVNGKKLIIH